MHKPLVVDNEFQYQIFMPSQTHFPKLGALLKDKNPVQRVLVVTLFANAELAYSVVDGCKNNDRIGSLNDQSLEKWLSLYSFPNLFNALGKVSEKHKDLSWEPVFEPLFLVALSLAYITPPEQKRHMIWNLIPDMEYDPLEEIDYGPFVELFSEIIFQAQPDKNIETTTAYFIQIWFQYLIYYQDYPFIILNKAKQGNEEALEKALRMDKALQFEPKIAQIIYEAQLTDEYFYRRIQSWIANKPKHAPSRKSIKMTACGFISAVSLLMNKYAFTPIIQPQELFEMLHAFAQDTDKGLVDTDFDNNFDSSFTREVRRQREKFQIIMKHLN